MRFRLRIEARQERIATVVVAPSFIEGGVRSSQYRNVTTENAGENCRDGIYGSLSFLSNLRGLLEDLFSELSFQDLALGAPGEVRHRNKFLGDLEG